MSRDERIDAYIAAKADFAWPILERLRSAVHAACPSCVETIKWGFPHFLYKGELLAGMAAFKAHATFGFWRGSLVVGTAAERSAMGQFGRLTSRDDLPPDEMLAALIRKAMALTDEGVKPVRNKTVKPPAATPDDLRAAIDTAPKAAATFDAFSPSCRRDYIEWVTEAKQPATRARRIAQTVEWLEEGKRRNWKYENC